MRCGRSCESGVRFLMEVKGEQATSLGAYCAALRLLGQGRAAHAGPSFSRLRAQTLHPEAGAAR